MLVGAKAPADESDGDPMDEEVVSPRAARSQAPAHNKSRRIARFFTMEVASKGDPALFDKWGEGETSKVVFTQMAMANGCVLCNAPLEPGKLFNEFRCSGCDCSQMIYPMKMHGMWFRRQEDAPLAAEDSELRGMADEVHQILERHIFNSVPTETEKYD